MTLEDLGYNNAFEENRKKLELCEFSVARIISEFKGEYKVINANGEHRARVTGKQMFTASSREDYPAVGDWVAISELDNGQAIIRGILPRQSILKRTFGDKNRSGEKDEIQVIAANIDDGIFFLLNKYRNIIFYCFWNVFPLLGKVGE